MECTDCKRMTIKMFHIKWTKVIVYIICLIGMIWIGDFCDMHIVSTWENKFVRYGFTVTLISFKVVAFLGIWFLTSILVVKNYYREGSRKREQ